MTTVPLHDPRLTAAPRPADVLLRARVLVARALTGAPAPGPWEIGARRSR